MNHPESHPSHPGPAPCDVHNQTLVTNAHPPDWVNPTPASRCNLVVIGAGTAGLVTSSSTTGLGSPVALVERHPTGGDCLNVGCVPSKSILRSPRMPSDVNQAAGLGIKVPPGAEVEFAAVMEPA